MQIRDLIWNIEFLVCARNLSHNNDITELSVHNLVHTQVVSDITSSVTANVNVICHKEKHM